MTLNSVREELQEMLQEAQGACRAHDKGMTGLEYTRLLRRIDTLRFLSTMFVVFGRGIPEAREHAARPGAFVEWISGVIQER